MSRRSHQYGSLGISHEVPLADTGQYQPFRGNPEFSDGSGPLFTMYNDMALEEDKKMAESWKEDSDRIVVFTGLFSAGVATLISVSIRDLQPNPQDRSTFYLQNIYQFLADPNTPNVSIPTTLADPPRFSPPRYAVWVNSLWFLSLAISLTCSLLATLVHQWARRYIKATQQPYRPHKRARIRAFFAEGAERLHLAWAVEAVPILLHLSLSLFFAGLLILLFNTDHTVFGIVAGWVGLCMAVYGCITLIPIFRHDSPYHSPLSSPVWSLLNGTIFAFVRILWSFKILQFFDFSIRDRMLDLGMLSYRRYREGMAKTAEETALKISPETDARALMWTLNSLDEDHELERFFAGIPGFCSSSVVSDPLGTFIEPNKWRLSEALIGLMHRTLTSSLVSESVRRCRALICMKAAHTASLPVHPTFCEQVINERPDGLLNYVEFGYFIKRNRHDDPSTAYYSTCMVAIVIAKVKERDDLWFELAMSHLGISAPVLRNYLAHGDSALLANYIHVLRDIVHTHLEDFRLGDAATRWKALELISRFDPQDTLPSLQYDFCNLWNEIVHMGGTTPDHRIRSILIALLKDVRRAYITLHEGTDSAPATFSASTTDDEHVLFLLSSYPLCNIPGHRPRPASHTPVAFSDVTISTYPPVPQTIVSPPTPSSYVPEISQINLDSHQLPPIVAHTSSSVSASRVLDAANASVVSSTTGSVPVAQSTPAALTTSTSPPTHTSPSSGTADPPLHRDAHSNPHSVTQDTTSPTFQVLGTDTSGTPSVVPQSAADQAASRSYCASSKIGSSPAFPATSPAISLPTSAPDWDAAEGSATTALYTVSGALNPTAVNSANSVAAPRLSQWPQPPSDRDMAVAAPSGSQLSRGTEKRVDRPSHVPHAKSSSRA